MKILICGGGGFFGRNLVRVLTREGINPKDVVIIDKDRKGLNYVRKFRVRTVHADLAEKGEWQKEFKGIDYVINLTAEISAKTKQPFVNNNIIATKNILEAIKKHNAKKLIHFSSAAVLSVRKDDYAKSKQIGEELVVKSKVPYVALRPSLMYGPTDDKNIGWLISFARKIPFFPIPGNGKYPRQPIYVDDVCLLLMKIMENFPKNKTYGINGSKIIYFKDMIKTVLKEMGGIRTVIYIPVWTFKLAMVMGNLIMKNPPFTPDQLDSLTSGDVFPDYPWWDEFNIKVTSFRKGVRKMLGKESSK